MQKKYFLKSKWRYILLAVLINLLTLQVHAQLSGKYTIDPKGSGSTNFTSFQMAVDSLNNNGVSGPVTIDVSDGTYSEQITLSSVKGASVKNTITFQSAKEDSSKVILTNASSTVSTDNFTLYFEGASYFTFKQITVERSGTDNYGRAVVFDKGATYNQILHCQLKAALNISSLSSVVYSPSGSNDDGNVFRQNLLKYGYYSFYFYGKSSSSLESGTVLEDNIIDSFYYYGIYLYYQDAPVITGNKLTNPVNTANYGIRVAYCQNDMQLMNNSFYSNSSSTMYGMYIYYCTGSTNSIIANNMISLEGSGSAYGVYLYYCAYQKLYHNSIRLDASGTTNRTMYVVGSTATTYSNNELINNIFVNLGTGPALYQTYAITTTKSDYNVFYAPNATNAFFYNALDYATLSDYQTASSLDANSLSVNPNFHSSSDLHTMAPALNGKGTPLSAVKYDFDMQTRDATKPDIGADEFTPPTNDAGINKLSNPYYACAGKEKVIVRLKNFGLDALDSVMITYELDGKIQSSKYYQLAPLKSAKDTLIEVGTITISSTIQNVKVYTEMPNGNADAINTNDTLNADVAAAMNGAYSIGTKGDYTSFTDAVDALTKWGVCSAVTFKVDDGTYTEQVSIPEIFGVSAKNTITFQGSDSTKTILEYASQSLSGNNFCLELNGASYITFRDMTLRRTGTNTYAQVVYIHGGSNNNTFTHNQFMGVYTGASSTLRALIYSNTDLDTGNVISHNLLKSSDVGIYFYGVNTTTLESGTIIENNIIDSIYTYGIYLYYQDAPIIRYNTLTNIISTSAYGIRAGYCQNGLQVYNNSIVVGGGYGLSIYYCTGTSSDMGMTYNNMVTVGGTSTAYGVYFYYSTYQMLAYNSILVTSTSSSGRALYAYGSTTVTAYNEMYNNIFVNTGGGYVNYTSNNQYIAKADNNNYYAPISSIPFYYATNYTSLSDYQKASGLDANSIEVDPSFMANDDLHTKSKLLDGKGTPVTGIDFDFDDEDRDTKTPDIGADEFLLPPNDIALEAIVNPISGSCGDSTTAIDVALMNFGNKSQTGFNVTVIVDDGTSKTKYGATYKGTLGSASMDTFTITTAFNTYAGGKYVITAYTELAKDADLTNDTATASFSINAIPDAPKATTDSSCGSAQLTFTAEATSSDYVIEWYDSPTSTTPLDTGNIFTTSVLTKSKTYYVSQKALTGCESPRTVVKGVVREAPKGVEVVKGSMFDGNFNDGTESDPDVLCAGNTISYELIPPKGYSYLDYGKKWMVKALDFETLAGTLPEDTSTSVNPKSGNLVLNFTPKLKFGDSTFLVRINVFDVQGGCDTTVARYIHVNAVPVANFNVENVCEGNDVIFTDSSLGNNLATYDYDFGDNTSEVTRNPIHTYSKPGTYEVRLLVTNTSGCVDTVKKIVNVYPAPVVGFNAASGCKGLPLQFGNTTTIADTSTLSYLWDFGDSVTSTLKNPSHIYTEDKSYKVRLKVTSIHGCTDSIQENVLIYSFPNADFNVNDVCEGGTTSFSATAISKSYTYTWNFGDNSTATGLSVEHKYAKAGTYTATLYVTNSNGCTDSSMAKVNVNPIPTATFVINDVCTGKLAIFTNDTSANPINTTYTWTFGDNQTSNSVSPIHVYNAAGTYTVTLIASAPGGCSDTMSMGITVHPLPVPDFSATFNCVGVPTIFTNNSSITGGNIVSTLWKFGDGDTSSATNPQHTYANPGKYNVILIVVSDNGCTDSIPHSVVIYAKPTLTFTKTVTNHTVVFTASNSTYSRYLWDFGDGHSDSGVVVNHTYNNDSIYTVSLHVYNANGCDVIMTDTVSIISSGIEASKANLLKMKIYPNPYQESIHLQYTLPTSAQVNITVFDLNGKQVASVFDGQQTAGEQSFTINAAENNFHSGMYLVRIIINDQVYYKQIIGLR